jgi:hypothetical protein
MTEPLITLLKRTEATLLAKSTQCRGSNSLEADVLDALEGCARQLEDRAAQCASWLFSIERWGDVPAERESEMRESCAEWLLMAS